MDDRLRAVRPLQLVEDTLVTGVLVQTAGEPPPPRASTLKSVTLCTALDNTFSQGIKHFPREAARTSPMVEDSDTTL